MSRSQKLGSLLSQTINVLVFDGHPDESVSARSYRQGVLQGDPVWKKRSEWIDKIFFWEPHHTFNAYKDDYERAEEIVDGLGKVFSKVPD